MTYGIVWEPEALAVAQKYAAGDRAGIQQVFQAVDLLADNPRPKGAFTVGASGIYRIQVGFYRVQYEVHDQTVTVTVFHLGRV
ncbi:type II toxin-antitoxin system RelE/ParE family toxin [Kitasatospora aureofaciens]|uniref:type II toxin-antitoxin system RelE family toxin n=1 Tax=Kitasatospora aureofaciens TaxID=1894 RepID=UPI001C444FBC|nr:type II toxin-antitoxin system RelE/ParE family toxin [Kitasatospora aureofaciens]MBV6703144.1 type II toxin-antitoxin system RelE/ParE family toxin [Kitasatospora aureofaciens]